MICNFCKKEIDKKDAFTFVMEGQVRTRYCCNKEEYDKYISRLYAESEAWNLSEEIVGHNTHTFKSRMWRQLMSEYDIVDIRDYLKENKDYIKRYMSTKNFVSDYNELAYYKSILVNNLNKLKQEQKPTPKVELPHEDLSDCMIGEGVAPSRKKRRNFSEINA